MIDVSITDLFYGVVAVATPKQIRELMMVEGLTNDEVKSHLQVKMIYLMHYVPIAPLISKNILRLSSWKKEMQRCCSY